MPEKPVTAAVKSPETPPNPKSETRKYVIAGILFLFILFVTTTASTPKDKIGLVYASGPLDDRQYIKTMKPGTGRFWKGLFNSNYEYPATTRTYIVSEREGEGDVVGSDTVTAPSKDGIKVSYEVAVYFKLNPDKIRQFHEKLGLKYMAWHEDGWNKLLEESVRQQIQFSIQKNTRRFEAVQIYSDAKVLNDIQQSIRESLPKGVIDLLGDEYFCSPDSIAGECKPITFDIKSVKVPDNVSAALEANRTSEIAVKTKQNEILQRRAEADAIKELNAALNEAGDSYVMLKAIESGKIDFWVLPDSTGVTIPRSPQ